MRVTVYGTEADRRELADLLACLPDCSYRNVRVAGMEGVIAARNTCGQVPVVWFSNDGGFGAQSYRLGCAYFHEKPVSPRVLSAAIAKCV